MVEMAAMIIFYGGLVLAVVLSLAGRIPVSLMILVPLLPLTNVLYRFHRFPLGKDFVDAILISMIIGWVFHAVISGERVMEQTPYNRLVLFMMVFSFFSLWQGSFSLGLPAPLSSGDVRVQDWKNYMVLPLIFFITVNNIKTYEQMRWLTVAMFASMLLVDLYTWKQIGYMGSLASRDKLTGTFVWLGPNQVAAFYVQCFFMLLGFFLLYRERFYRLFFGALLIPAFVITLFLYSRGAYLAILTGLLTVSFLKKKALIIPLLMAVVLWQVVLPRTVVDRIKETRSSGGSLDSSSEKRLELWRQGLGMFMQNPISGMGFDVIAAQGLKYGFKDTHNIFVKILAEQGLIGMVIFLLLFGKAFRRSLLLFRQAEEPFAQGLGLGFAACVVATFTTNIFGDRWTFMSVSSYFWTFMAMVERSILIEQEQEEGSYTPEYETAA